MTTAIVANSTEAKLANVAANLFFPLEQRLGNFKVEEGANKTEVLHWWAEMLGNYSPEDLQWFVEYWLRTDQKGRFPRSPGAVMAILSEFGRGQGRLVLSMKPLPAYTPDLEWYRWFKSKYVDNYHKGSPWWFRRAVECAVDEIVRAWVKDNRQTYNLAAGNFNSVINFELAAALAARHDKAAIFPGALEIAQVTYERARQLCEEALASPNDLNRAVGRLMQATWEDERKKYDDWEKNMVDTVL